MSHLTKSRYMAGRQCLRRLWLLVNEPPEWAEPPAGSVQDVGLDVGQKAHRLFPGGVLVAEEPWEHAAAVVRTKALMADKSVPAIFEATFEHENIRVRVDVLERLAGGWWGLREVKSSGGVKDIYLDDVAVQVYVLKGAGVRLSSMELIHINTSYVRKKQGIVWKKFFARADVKKQVLDRMPDLPEQLDEQKSCLRKRKEPTIEPGGHCWTPYGCEYVDLCTADKPDDWIHYLPRLREDRLAELEAMGVEAIGDIPADFPLTEAQVVIRDVVVTGKPFISSQLPGMLEGFGPPALYLDFEASQPAIPLFAGTHPFEAIPFQWSLHILGANGDLTHQEFLADGRDDPRRPFVETLIKAVGRAQLPILVYSSYEKARLTSLAEAFPELADDIEAIIDRLRDLLPVVRKGLYHPDFGFSNSIKAVGPALCPGFGYHDLDEVADGAAASAAFVRLASGELTTDAVEALRKGLLAYCERDTLAMVEVHRAILGLATNTKPPAD